MRKSFKMIIVVILFLGCILNLCTSITKAVEEKIYSYEDVKDIVIRFHVLANSDTNEDQNLKLKVRDEVINYLFPYLNDINSREEAREIIKENEEKVKEIARNIIKDQGYDYDVTTEFGQENFPEKSYGNIVLPQGNYEAFRILIGKGEGHNWWCVMFPSLCFIDVSKGEVEQEKSREKLDEAVNENKSEEKVEVKFKFLEFIKKIFD
ncbi:MAG: stage II sporulation protein R [Clostridium sp.]|nr:stage II sporulation protein R [Clostridium sp.]